MVWNSFNFVFQAKTKKLKAFAAEKLPALQLHSKMAKEHQTKINMENFKNEQHKEGPIAKKIENETAKLPSDVFLWASTALMSTSLMLQLMGKKHSSLFVGQWVAPFLIFGLYNKIVKTEGHDKTDTNNRH